MRQGSLVVFSVALLLLAAAGCGSEMTDEQDPTGGTSGAGSGGSYTGAAGSSGYGGTGGAGQSGIGGLGGTSGAAMLHAAFVPLGDVRGHLGFLAGMAAGAGDVLRRALRRTLCGCC